jgi:hypothetical protein
VVDLFPLLAWHIDLIGEPEAVTTWDHVFDIRRRYEGKVNAHFRDWVEQFACCGRTDFYNRMARLQPQVRQRRI